MPFVTAVHLLGAAAGPTVAPPTGFFGALARGAEAFISTFQLGATYFVGLLTGIVPLLIVLLTAVNALVRLIGQERVEKLGVAAGQSGIIWYPVRYLVLPVVAVFLFTNPMCYTVGSFLPERFKPAFYDSAVSFVHPITGLFPHANSGELFVYLGVAAGLTKLGLPLGDIAVRYLLVGMVVILIRGILTEFITKALMARRTRAEEAVAA
jgi:PTS system glucitol/sorbitol-specific IIC component